MEGWNAVFAQKFSIGISQGGSADDIANSSKKRVVALAEVEFHFVFVFLFLSFGFLPFDVQTF